MPNWCSTQITFSGCDAAVLHDKIESWAYDALDNGFGRHWLGNIAINSGLITKEEINNTDLSLRGSIQYLSDVDDDRFILDQEDAWSPNVVVWKEIIEFFNYDVSFTFMAIEPGNGIYETNDPALIDYYYIDCYMDDGKYSYIDDLSSAATLDFLRDILRERNVEYDQEDCISELVDRIDNLCESGSDYCSVHRYQFYEV